MHPDIAHLVAVGQVETDETRTPSANSLHPDTSLTWTQVNKLRSVRSGQPAPIFCTPTLLTWWQLDKPRL